MQTKFFSTASCPPPPRVDIVAARLADVPAPVGLACNVTFDRSQRRPHLPWFTVAGLLLTGWAFAFAIPADAIAGCGDYLLPPIEIERQQALPAEMVAAGYKAPHQSPPCRGPSCHHSPRHDLPTPAPAVPVFTEHWACPPTVAVVTLSQTTGWTPVAAALSLRESSYRLDRPPRG